MAILGIDLGGTKTSLCVGTEEGRLLGRERFATGVEKGPEAWLARVGNLLPAVLEQADTAAGNVRAAGLAAPGPLSVTQGILLNPPNMTGWVRVPIVEMLASQLALPVFMNNDANAAALAEWMFGEFHGADHLIYLTMSTGLGAGIIANGKLIQGTNDLAGEVGYHVLDIHGPPSPCGHRGSFEAFCGGKNVADRLRRAAMSGAHDVSAIVRHAGSPEKIDFKAFLVAVKDGDAFALEVWDEYLERLAQGIANLIMILNPEAVVLGTIAIHAGDALMVPLRDRLRKYAHTESLAACRIRPSILGSRLGDLGALAVAIDGLARAAVSA